MRDAYEKRILCLLSVAAVAAGCTEKGMFDNIHVRPNTTLPVGNVVASDSSLFELADIQKTCRSAPTAC